MIPLLALSLLEGEPRDVVGHALVREREDLPQRLVTFGAAAERAQQQAARAGRERRVVAAAEEVGVGLGERGLEPGAPLGVARFAEPLRGAVRERGLPQVAPRGRARQCSRAAASLPASACSSPQ